MQRHILIEAVEPVVDCGRYPAKFIAGDTCVVTATIFRDSADIIRAALRWGKRDRPADGSAPLESINPGLDLWRGEFVLPAEIGRYQFEIEAWTDVYAGWVRELTRKVEAGRADLESEMAEGLMLIRRVHERASAAEKDVLAEAIAALQPGSDPKTALAVCSRPDVEAIAERHQPREDLVTSGPYHLLVERMKARFSAWYELFIRSQGPDPTTTGTFSDAKERLPYVRDLGFDVIYLAPIHPIGRTARKGRNNALIAGPDDPGSPWAIGNEHGGHKAVEPSLGTLDDFVDYVRAANAMGIEIALDFAIQCSPDHPWVKEHPEWFHHRPDGTIKYAENPPKKYEDIYPVNFDTDARDALWAELKDTLLFWIERGVRIFRVDNPHTKSFFFWEWVIEEIHRQYPDVIFLAEAFSRPPIMKALAKLGFTQSYTYFTWRNTRQELTEYLTELTRTDMAKFYRPNFFANTPDILHEFLQHGGPPAFRLRFVLAATLSPAFGIYSGYELFENVPVAPGKEEYLNSEKYEIKHRDWSQPNMGDLIARVNRIRAENPALHELTNLHFVDVDNEQIIAYVKLTRDRSNTLLIVVNLDPHHAQEGTVRVPLDLFDLPWSARYDVRDLLTDRVFDWGEYNYVRLDPGLGPAHILRLEGQR